MNRFSNCTYPYEPKRFDADVAVKAPDDSQAEMIDSPSKEVQ